MQLKSGRADYLLSRVIFHVHTKVVNSTMGLYMAKISEVFTPNDTPTITYVEREDLKLEENFRSYLELPKMVVSISGPSKSGKTVLIKQVLDDDNIIPIIGSGISSVEDLWRRALAWMEVPASTTASKSSSKQIGAQASGGGEVGIPLIAKGKGEAGISGAQSWDTSTSTTSQEPGLSKVVEEIGGSDFVIFLDDFHYIREELREEIGRQIKVAADNGVKFVTASVPHRSDDVVRSNPELRGRVAAVDLGYWGVDHLKIIAERGFAELGFELSDRTVKRLAEEAMGSPQLMQTICYCLCQKKGISETIVEPHDLAITEKDIQAALKQTSHFTDFSKMLGSLHSGPRTRGQERKVHDFRDGSTGDVYRAVLLAMRIDPISMSFSYEDITTRIKTVCKEEIPAGSSITSCLEQMTVISETMQPGRPVLAWDGDNLDVTDPYFAFFLRSSDKINIIK